MTMYCQLYLNELVLISIILSGFNKFCRFSPAEMAETMAEILSPLFLPFVRQKYLSARQKTNTAPSH